MTEKKFSLGLDFGTNSVRALIVDVENGEEIGSCVYNYRRGEDGVILDEKDPNFARQDPKDYWEGMEASIQGALREARDKKSFRAEGIVGIGIDTTGSTLLPVDEDGLPLSFQEEFKNNPAAMVWLWKDHTSFEEAALITARAKEDEIDYTKYSGGIYSSEWFFSKILHLAKVAPEVFRAAASFVEHCDLMPALLVGDTKPQNIKRSRCAAGHKAMFNREWGGLPAEQFFCRVDEKLKGIRDKLYQETYTADVKVGGLSKEWAEKLSLSAGVSVSVGAFDAHMGAVGAGIKPGTLVKIMGTSTCDTMIAPPETLKVSIEGICGQVEGSIIPGFVGLEAGQSAVGDIFAWYRDQLRWPVENILSRTSFASSLDIKKLMEETKDLSYEILTEKAKSLRAGQSGLLALDWLNGNRTILVDPNLTGQIIGLTLQTRPEEIFLALIESTAFGAKVIMDRISEYGIDIEEVITCGGLAERNPLLMQVYADIIGKPIKISRSAQTCALGAAMFGAVAAGHYPRVEDAQGVMGGLKSTVYYPREESMAVYSRLFKLYKTLHDSLGTKNFSGDLYPVMKELLKIKREVMSKC
ncbi:MAG: ribulokinase [Nitrospirae bacterium]|nr:ribulokinase [Nitrospirota bacterium]